MINELRAIPGDLTYCLIQYEPEYYVNYARIQLKWGDAPVEKTEGLYGEQVRTISKTPSPKYIRCNEQTVTIPFSLEQQLVDVHFNTTKTVEIEFTGDYIEDLLVYEILTGYDFYRGGLIQTDGIEIEVICGMNYMGLPVGGGGV